MGAARDDIEHEPGHEPGHALGHAIDELWHAVERIAATAEQPRPEPQPRHPTWLNPVSLARELGHQDGGSRVRGFLRSPDDGGAGFDHDRLQHWRLTDEEADRVRRRFRPVSRRLRLSAREHETVALYVDGRSVPEVARHLRVGDESVRTYLRRARAKIRAAGHPATTRADLRQHLDGREAS